MFRQNAWAVRSHSSDPLAARTVGTWSTVGCYCPELSPCIKVMFHDSVLRAMALLVRKCRVNNFDPSPFEAAVVMTGLQAGVDSRDWNSRFLKPGAEESRLQLLHLGSQLLSGINFFDNRGLHYLPYNCNLSHFLFLFNIFMLTCIPKILYNGQSWNIACQIN